MNPMRVDIAAKPVGTFYGGKKEASVSVPCSVCGRPGLIVREGKKDGQRTRWVSHGFYLALNVHNEPVCTWDEPCVAVVS